MRSRFNIYDEHDSGNPDFYPEDDRAERDPDDARDEQQDRRQCDAADLAAMVRCGEVLEAQHVD